MVGDPFAYFYLLYKIHKTPIKTRPVSSQCGSVSYAIGQYVDEMLQPTAKAQQSYFQDSFALKKLLNGLVLHYFQQMWSVCTHRSILTIVSLFSQSIYTDQK